MSCCTLEYIPPRLHYSEDRQIIDIFHVNDILYRRVKPQNISNPFDITLTDLSHNIGTNNTQNISEAKDVLFSIMLDEDFQLYENCQILELRIESLNNNVYDKTFTCPKNEELKVRLFLSHDPVCCMYPHCVFRFFLLEQNETEVTFNNYKETLGHKKYKYLRTELRNELTLMVIRKIISYDSIN